MKTIKKILGRCGLALRLSFALAAATVIAAPVADARIVRLEILSVESPTFEGVSFGDVGQYEKVYARAHGEVDPADPRNARITRHQAGPAQCERDGRIFDRRAYYQTREHVEGKRPDFFEVVNRGNKGIELSTARAGTTYDRGGFGHRNAHASRLYDGLDWLGRRRTPAAGGPSSACPVSVARNPDGSSFVEVTISEDVFDTAPERHFGLNYRAAKLDQSQATILVRNHTQFVGGRLVDRVEVPTSVWSYVDDRRSGSIVQILSLRDTTRELPSS